MLMTPCLRMGDFLQILSADRSFTSFRLSIPFHPVLSYQGLMCMVFYVDAIVL